MTEINKYLQATTKTRNLGNGIIFQVVRPAIICKDGERVSIQAGQYMYSFPREDQMSHYFKIEAGFPSAIPPISWKEYAEEWEIPLQRKLKNFFNALRDKRFPTMRKIYWQQLINPTPTQTVYGYMPVEIAQEFIDIHGGIDWDKYPEVRDE